MSLCQHCSAPLPTNTDKCIYCGARNDVDLHARLDYDVVRQQSERLCPHCEKPLQTIDLHLDGAFLIERCEDCFGLFFDPGQIEILLESSVSHVFEINLEHLDNINKDRFQGNKPVKYVKCPVCHVLMNRNAYGYRSGVIIDRCRNHGVWLDSGEITHLMEWKKAGGQLLQDKHAASENRKAESNHRAMSSQTNNVLDYRVDADELDIFNAVAAVITKLF